MLSIPLCQRVTLLPPLPQRPCLHLLLALAETSLHISFHNSSSTKQSKINTSLSHSLCKNIFEPICGDHLHIFAPNSTELLQTNLGAKRVFYVWAWAWCIVTIGYMTSLNWKKALFLYACWAYHGVRFLCYLSPWPGSWTITHSRPRMDSFGRAGSKQRRKVGKSHLYSFPSLPFCSFLS